MAEYRVTIKAKGYYDTDVDAKNIEQAKKIAMKAYYTMKKCHGADFGKPYGMSAKVIMAEPLRLVKEEKTWINTKLR